jgi:hypothetical protein
MLFNANPQARLVELQGATGHTILHMDVVERALREID